MRSDFTEWGDTNMEYEPRSGSLGDRFPVSLSEEKGETNMTPERRILGGLFSVLCSGDFGAVLTRLAYAKISHDKKRPTDQLVGRFWGSTNCRDHKIRDISLDQRKRMCVFDYSILVARPV